MPAAPFKAKLVWHSPGLGLVEVAGEVDMNTAQELDAILVEALRGGADRLVVDLTAVGFIDSIGLSVLVRNAKLLLARGGAYDIVCGSRLMRIFEIAGLPEVLSFHSTLTDALTT